MIVLFKCLVSYVQHHPNVDRVGPASTRTLKTRFRRICRWRLVNLSWPENALLILSSYGIWLIEAIKDIEGEIAVNKEEIIKNNKSKDQVNNKFTYTKSLNSKKKTDILRKKSDQIDGFINEIKDEIDQLRK